MNEIKKNIIIIGPPRSGKTTLAKKIVKEFNNFSLISADNFTTSFICTCKDMAINSINMAIPRKQCFYYCIESMHYEGDINYVIDVGDYDEEMFERIKNNSIIIFLGYSNLNSKELYNNIRKFDKPNDWTYIEGDYMLSRYCDAFIEQSKSLELIAKDNNYWYVDVSEDRECVLLNTFEKIKTILNENKN